MLLFGKNVRNLQAFLYKYPTETAETSGICEIIFVRVRKLQHFVKHVILYLFVISNAGFGT